MLLGFAGFMIANILLVTMTAGNYVLLLVSVLIEAASLAVFGPLMDALTVVSIDNAERARVNAIVFVVVVHSLTTMYILLFDQVTSSPPVGCQLDQGGLLLCGRPP